MAFQLSVLQYACGETTEETLRKAETLIRRAASEGGQVICLQELFHSPYFCRHVDPTHFGLAQEIPGPLTERFAAIAQELEVVIVLPVFESAGPGVYFNAACVLDADGTVMGPYRKMHIPEDPGFHEKYYFTPGDRGYQVFATRHGRIGVLICWDQWYPEAARITSLMGAELLVYPTAIGVLEHETESERNRFHDAWKTVQRGHAIANGLYVAAANRVGTEHGTTYWGGSFIAGPFGEMLAEAGDGEQILHAVIDRDALIRQRQEWPFFRDRRIDSFGPVLRRWIGDAREGSAGEKVEPRHG